MLARKYSTTIEHIRLAALRCPVPLRASLCPSRRRPAYDPGMSDRKTRLTITVDPHLSAYAEQLVEEGKAPSVSAVFNDALSEKARRDRRALDRLREIAAQADPAKVARMMAHIDAQVAALPKR
jgi:Arc/MetJ-type ribon-helix-helix transcriptional regulator